MPIVRACARVCVE